MIELEIFYPPATPEEHQAALRAAWSVFHQADVDPYRAWLALGAEITYVESGCDESQRPTEDEQRLCRLIGEAQAAANRVLGVPDGQPVTLDFVER